MVRLHREIPLNDIEVFAENVLSSEIGMPTSVHIEMNAARSLEQPTFVAFMNKKSSRICTTAWQPSLFTAIHSRAVLTTSNSWQAEWAPKGKH